ncbi:hypothetical protein BDU57DRAFT_48296 [Ampelomyces quisqualis]|uniref:Uncharacterized protein n=1 Tax=Ampelomyces quisqualis TaxID=50730 RepID=A0A6A5R3L5_AMPQU|nr:hypothetical protein BDU57DRAFT_48296 [Ampelomyces quisqualis]
MSSRPRLLRIRTTPALPWAHGRRELLRLFAMAAPRAALPRPPDQRCASRPAWFWLAALLEAWRKIRGLCRLPPAPLRTGPATDHETNRLTHYPLPGRCHSVVSEVPKHLDTLVAASAVVGRWPAFRVTPRRFRNIATCRHLEPSCGQSRSAPVCARPSPILANIETSVAVVDSRSACPPSLLSSLSLLLLDSYVDDPNVMLLNNCSRLKQPIPRASCDSTSIMHREVSCDRTLHTFI